MTRAQDRDARAEHQAQQRAEDEVELRARGDRGSSGPRRGGSARPSRAWLPDSVVSSRTISAARDFAVASAIVAACCGVGVGGQDVEQDGVGRVDRRDLAGQRRVLGVEVELVDDRLAGRRGSRRPST